MWRFLLVVIGAVFAAMIAVGFSAWRHVSRRRISSRHLRLTSNRQNRLRLSVVVSELLAHANELDQASKFAQPPVPAEWDKSLAQACNQLVLLSQALELMQQSMEGRDPSSVQHDILRCCRVASHVSYQLRLLNQHVLCEAIDSPLLQTEAEGERH